MKIIFLVVLIAAVLICIESYVGAQHMMHYAPVNPHQGAQHMMHYAPVTPHQGAQQMMRHAPVNPHQGAQQMVRHAPVNPHQGVQQMVRRAPVNPHQGAQQMVRHAPVNPHQGAQQMERHAPVNPHQGGQHVMHYVPVNPDKVAQHKMNNAQVNANHCRLGPHKRDCFPGPYTYEYVTAEYSAEREYHTESYIWPIRRTYCPRRYSWPCSQKVNECCSDKDCDPIQLCCFENCGNTCQFPVSFPADGVRVNQHDPYCQVHPMFERLPVPPIYIVNKA